MQSLGHILRCNTQNVSKILRMNNKTRMFCSTYESESIRHFDIVVSGGGMVGFAAAASLGHNNLLQDKNILVLEKQAEQNWTLPEEYSNRVCTLNSETQQLFIKLGAWKHVADMRVQPVRKMQVWESASDAMITFDEGDLDSDQVVAHVVENDVILNALKKVIPSNVQVEYCSQVSSYNLPHSTDEPVTITLKDGQTIITDLLVGADGARSGVRVAMGTQTIGCDYDHAGIVATLQLSEEVDNCVAWQKFVPSGPIALLPLSSNRCSLVWSTSRSEAAHLMQLDDGHFVDKLNNAIWNDSDFASSTVTTSLHSQWLSFLQLTSGFWTSNSASAVGVKQLPPSVAAVVARSRASFPLGIAHSAKYVAPRVALIGDAAHRVHPLAGQGVNLGFGDVVGLTQALEGAVKDGRPFVEYDDLCSYETCRQRHNVPMLLGIDSLYRLYTSNAAPVVLLRSLGLSTVQAIQPIKKCLIDQARG